MIAPEQIEKFNYRNIQDIDAAFLPHPVGKREYFIMPSPVFLQLERKDLKRGEKGRHEGRSNKYKIHISIAKEDVEKAWNVLLPVLFKHDVALCKVVREKALDRMNDPEDGQAGKFITLYLMDRTHEAGQLVTEIERTLEAHHINTGHAVKGDKLLEGSNYQYYRNDGIEYYKPAADLTRLPTVQRFNPDGHADPFAFFSVAKDADNHQYSFGNYPELFFGKQTQIEPAKIFNAETNNYFWVFRTRAGAFSKEELETYKETLEKNGVRGLIAESQSQKGKFYLAVNIDPDDLQALDDVVIKKKGIKPLDGSTRTFKQPEKTVIDLVKAGEVTDLFKRPETPVEHAEDEPLTQLIGRDYVKDITGKFPANIDPQPGQPAPGPAASGGSSHSSSSNSSSPEPEKSSKKMLATGAALLAAGAAGYAVSGSDKKAKEEKTGFAKVASIALGVIGAGIVAYDLFKRGKAR